MAEERRGRSSEKRGENEGKDRTSNLACVSWSTTTWYSARSSNEALPPSDGVRTVHGKQRLAASAEKEKVGRRNTNCFCPSLYPVFSLPFSSISILPPSRLVAFLSLSVSRRRRRRRRRYCAAAAPPPLSSPNAFMWC